MKRISPLAGRITFPAVLSALVIASVPTIAADSPRLTLTELLTRHEKAVGKHASPLPLNVQVSGALEGSGLRGTFRTTEKPPDKEYTQTTLGDETFSSGYDGKNAWCQDANGNVRLMTREELKGERTDAEAALQAGIVAAHLTLRPIVERTSDDYIVDAQPPGGKAIAIYLDPMSFLVRKTEVAYDDQTVTTTYQAWQTTDGATYPARWTVSSGTAKYDEVYSITGIAQNVDAPDTLFAVPSPPKNYRFLKPGITAVSVPFRYQDTKIAMTGVFNGVPTRFALDSGAGGIALSQALTDELGIQPQGTFQSRGIGGSLPAHEVRLKTFEIPDAIEFDNISASSGIPVIGFSALPLTALVGYDLLSRFVVRVDYTDQQVTFTEPDAFTPSATDGVALPLELDDDMPTVEAQFDAFPPARFLIDTGDPGTIRLNAPYVSANRLRERYKKGQPLLSGGIAGAAEFDVAHARSLKLAGVTIPGIPTSFPHDLRGGSSQEVAGAIGAQVLRRFTVTFDYPHQRLFLAANPDAAQPFETRGFGIALKGRQDDKGKLRVYVTGLDPDGQAHKDGLMLLDEVEKIDGDSVSDLSVDEISKRLSVNSDKPIHRLSVRHLTGEKGAINVRLYDLLPSP